MKTKAPKIAAVEKNTATLTKRQIATKSGTLSANDVAFKCCSKSNAFGLMIAVVGFSCCSETLVVFKNQAITVSN